MYPISVFASDSSVLIAGVAVRMCQIFAPGDPAPGYVMLIGTLKIAIGKQCHAFGVSDQPAASQFGSNGAYRSFWWSSCPHVLGEQITPGDPAERAVGQRYSSALAWF